jgi:hypothetical protein
MGFRCADRLEHNSVLMIAQRHNAQSVFVAATLPNRLEHNSVLMMALRHKTQYAFVATKLPDPGLRSVERNTTHVFFLCAGLFFSRTMYSKASQ